MTKTTPKRSGKGETKNLRRKTTKDRDCPLWLHPGGQWTRKIRGKFHYFGRDLDIALKRWADEKDYLLAGRPIPRTDSSPSVDQVCNAYLDMLRNKVRIGQMSAGYLDTQVRCCEMLVDTVGKQTRLHFLSETDWTKLWVHLAEGVAPTTLSSRVLSVRTLAKFASKIGPVVRVPDTFQVASSRQCDSYRAKKQDKRFFSKEDIHKLLANSTPAFKPILLLAINCGLPGSDIAEIQTDELHLDAQEVWLRITRTKTGTTRRFPLWPETVIAIKDYLKTKPLPLRQQDRDLLFLTGKRRSWRASSSGGGPTADCMAYLRKKAKLPNAEFYSLRRTFATVASKTRDLPTVRFLMGHKVGQKDILLKHYLAEPTESEIREVVNFVRSWLFEVKP
jgi:integrase